MPFIEVENLTVRYPTRRSPALRGVSFSVEPGESLLVLGPSGGGKSTLALCLNGLIPHSINAEVEGNVRVAGRDAHQAKPGELSQQVGIVFQDPESQFSTLTVADEVAFGLENLGLPRGEMDARIDQALAGTMIKTGIGGKANVFFLYRCVHVHPFELMGFDHLNLQPGSDSFLEQFFGTGFTDALAPSGHARKTAFRSDTASRDFPPIRQPHRHH